MNKKMLTAAAAAVLAVSAGAFAADAASPTNEAKIGPAQPAHGPEAAKTIAERTPLASSIASLNHPHANAAAIHSNEGTIWADVPAPLIIRDNRGAEQSTELKLGPAAPAHGPEAATPAR